MSRERVCVAPAEGHRFLWTYRDFAGINQAMVCFVDRIFWIGLAAFIFLLGCANPKEGAEKATPVTAQAGDAGNMSEPADQGAREQDRGDDTDMLVGVDAGQAPEGEARPPAIPQTAPPSEPPSFPKPLPGNMVSIGGGTLLAGSPPDDVLRIQHAENDMIPHEMHPFEIDALPYPGDPDRAFLTGVTRAEAEQHCLEEGKRLCTELEWEWACKSAQNVPYPTGNYYVPAAYSASELWLPASHAGVFAMGRIMEWTASAWGLEEGQRERAVARGFGEGQEEPEARGRRCAMRWRRLAEGTNPSLGFRCCRGEPNEAACFIEKSRAPHRVHNSFTPEVFERVIRSIPQLAAVHENPHMYGDGDVRAVLARRRSDREELAGQGIHFDWKPIRWSPRQGMRLLVVAGRSGPHSFIAALHEIENKKRYIHASSLILWNQPLPLALVYLEGQRDDLFWAPCWVCRDGGKISYDEENNEVIITNRW